MLQVPLKRVPIRRDMAETLLVDVGEHEIPVLIAVHGEGKVQTELICATDDVATIDDPKIEYERLGRLYGVDAQTGRRFVDIAYSDFRRFLEDLQAFAGVPKRRKVAADA
jgi:hypothetical protein